VDQLCQHFTTPPFNSALIFELTSASPHQVLDVAAGQGSLALAAKYRYQNAHVTTLEINSKSRSYLRGVMPDSTHLLANLLKLKIPAAVRRLVETADLVLCNPPFRATESETSPALLREAEMPTDWPLLLRQRAEVAFLAHNLRMLKQGGELGMFLPSSFMTGHKFEPFREWLMNCLTVEKVIGFPTFAFGGTQAKAYALIARKLSPSAGQRTTLLELDFDGFHRGKAIVGRKDAIMRLDAAFHLERKQQTAGLTLGKIGAILSRGLPVQELQAGRHAYFHTTDFKTSGQQRAFGELSQNSFKLPLAHAGDFLLGRVGRACHTQVLYVKSGSIPFSDCVYRLRVPREMREAVRLSLFSKAGMQWRHSRMHGVGAAVLSKRDLLEHPIWLRGAP